MKIIRNILLGLLAFIIIVLVAVYFYAGALIKRGVEYYVPPITGTSVSLSSVLLSPFTGSITIRGLVVGNPKGFSIPNAFSVAKVAVSVDLKSLMTDKIIIKEVHIVKPQISAEINTNGMNLTTLNDHVQRALQSNEPTQGTPEKKAAEPAKKSKSVVIRLLRIEGGSIQLGFMGQSQTIPLPDIEQRNIGESKPQTIAQTVAQVMSILSSESVKVATSEVKKLGQKAVQQTKEAIEQQADNIKNTVSDKVGNVDTQLKAIKNLF